MNKNDILARGAEWESIAAGLEKLMGGEFLDIREWVADVARVADSRARECRAIAKALPTGSGGEQ